MPGPLTGYRVVDFSRVLAGPHCAKTLLDLGADVVKIEPPRGDMSRSAYPRRGEISGYYAQQNAGKRNISIDLTVEGAREIALRLCDSADVVVENFRPGTLDPFGLGYDVVSARNPRVVYASLSGYGQRGAWSRRMAYAPTVQAETGFTRNTTDHFGGEGTVGGGRLQTDALSHADVYTGIHGAIAILAALTERERTGQGQHVDVAMAAVMTYINEGIHKDLSEDNLGAERAVLGATDAPFFVSPEGDLFVSPFSLVGSLTFPYYCAAMRRPELVDDPRFRTPEARAANLPALHEIIQTWMRTFGDMASLDAHLDEAKIATGKLRTIQEFAQSDWVRDWGATRTVPDRSGGTMTIPGAPWHFSGSKPEADFEGAEQVQVPARQGEHNRGVLVEVGFNEEEIAALEISGALVQPSRGMTG